MLLRKRAASAIGPRLNQWKGARASQVADQRQQTRFSHARRRIDLQHHRTAARGNTKIDPRRTLTTQHLIAAQRQRPYLQSHRRG